MSILEDHIKTATHLRITIHDIADSGSAFAMTDEGEMVFINQRIVSTVGVEPGMVYEAFVLPNYEDKRDMIPWRALRVSSLIEGSKDSAPVDEKLLHAIVRLLTKEGYMTASEISEALDTSVFDVRRALEGGKGIIMSVPSYFVP